jgi:hypothetical protein
MDRIRAEPGLLDMLLLRRGMRLSVQPVTEAEYHAIVALGQVAPPPPAPKAPKATKPAKRPTKPRKPTRTVAARAPKRAGAAKPARPVTPSKRPAAARRRTPKR